MKNLLVKARRSAGVPVLLLDSPSTFSLPRVVQMRFLSLKRRCPEDSSRLHVNPGTRSNGNGTLGRYQ